MSGFYVVRQGWVRSILKRPSLKGLTNNISMRMWLWLGVGRLGLSTAVAAAETGAQVALFDENAMLGGHLVYGSTGVDETINDLLTAAADLPNLRLFTNTTVFGWWEDNWLAAVSGQRLYKIRGQAAVFASGVYEQPLVFANNDLPGVMLGTAVQRLVNLYSVKPGENAVVITANDSGWQVAANLQEIGVTVTAVADERSGAAPDLVEKVVNGGTAVHWGHTILAANGSGKVESAQIAAVANHEAKQTLACDLIVIAIGWTPANGLLYQAGAEIKYDEDRALFLPQSLPDGIFCCWSGQWYIWPGCGIVARAFTGTASGGFCWS